MVTAQNEKIRTEYRICVLFLMSIFLTSFLYVPGKAIGINHQDWVIIYSLLFSPFVVLYKKIENPSSFILMYVHDVDNLIISK